MVWLVILMANIEPSRNEYVLQDNLRVLQMTPLESLAYSSYTSIQIFNLLNWKINNQIIQSINNNKDSTFTAAHNQFSFLSFTEITQQYLTVQVN